MPAFGRSKSADSCRGCCCSGPSHYPHHRAILHPFQIAEIMLDVIRLTQLVGPASIGQLPSGVLRIASAVDEKSDLFEARFRLGACARLIIKAGKRLLEKVERFSSLDLRGPVFILSVG